MSQLRRHGVAVAGRTGGRVGHAAGCQNHPVGEVTPRGTRNAHRFTAVCKDALYPIRLYCHMKPAQLPCQAIENGLRFIRHRKHPVSPFCFQRTAAPAEKGHGFRGWEGSHGTVEEAPVTGRVLQDLLAGAVICDVTSSLAGDQQFLSQPVITLQKQHPFSPHCGSDGGKHTSRAAADHDSVIFHRFSTCFS